jgi:Tol biopolymer transport system component
MRFLLALPIVFIGWGYAQQDIFPNLSGPYLGQTPPGFTPEVFAPGIISTNAGEGCSGFMLDGKLFLFRRRSEGILSTEMKNGFWTPPEKVSFALPGHDGDFIIAPDGKTVYFASDRLVPESSTERHNIWKTEKTPQGWTEPVRLEPPVNTDAHESYPSLSEDGTLCFFSRREGGFGKSDIYLSKLVDGKYRDVVNIGDIINTEHHEVDPYIAPDESYLLFASDRPGGYGRDDFYISFKTTDGKWSSPMNMGDSINSPHTEYICSVTLDGKYLFFTSNKNGSRDIFWVDSRIIDELRASR